MINQLSARRTLSESSFYGLNPVIKVKVIKVIKVFQSNLILNGHPLNLRFYYKLFIIMRKIKEIIIRIKRKYSKPSQQLYKRIMWVALSKSIWTINYKNLNFQSHSFNTICDVRKDILHRTQCHLYQFWWRWHFCFKLAHPQ